MPLPQLLKRGAAMRVVQALAGATALLLSIPATALGHEITERYQAPLPLAAYVAGAAIAVAMSFAFVLLRNAPPRSSEVDRRRPNVVPGWLRLTLQAAGLIAFAWIVLQTFAGGGGIGDVPSLFVWTFGWVGVALLSALLGPIWEWLDPFATLHRLLGAAGERLGVASGEPADYPERLGRWPAVVAFVAVIWLELVAQVEGGRTLGLIVIGYAVLNLGAMSYFGRETWRAHGEVFTVWFRLLGRLAPFELIGTPDEGRVRRRPFAAGLLARDWTRAEVVLVTLGTASIIFDGLAQTQIYFDALVLSGVFGTAIVRDTVSAVLFHGMLLLIVLVIARRLGMSAVGAGLLPVAVGYLIAHYLSFVLVDGQRLFAALNDPLARGDALLGLDFTTWEPQSFVPTAILWSIQLGAVVGGHIVGAWAGHAALADQAGPRRMALQLPLAALMIALTSLTLWSLGQSVLVDPGQADLAAVFTTE